MVVCFEDAPMIVNLLTIERLGDMNGVVCLHGPLTIENVRLFQNAIRREEKADTVILDLTGVPYIDSSGLGSLVGAYISRQKMGRRVALTGVNERIFNLFEVTRTDSLFLIFDTVDHALEALHGGAQA
jgi:anti-sigma B factor antagonist